MYKAEMFEYAGEHLHGQVVDNTNRPSMVKVHIEAGVIAVSLTAVIDIPPPLVFLFYALAWKTSTWTRERMLAVHRVGKSRSNIQSICDIRGRKSAGEMNRTTWKGRHTSKAPLVTGEYPLTVL